MINIDTFRTFVNTVANKNGRGTITPAQFNSVTERALFAWTNNQISNQKQYRPNDPTPQTSLDLDQTSIERLKHLKENRWIKVLDGKMDYPNGSNTDLEGETMPEMWIYSRLIHKYLNHGNIVTRPIEVVKDQEWGLKLSSRIVMPTKDHTIANFQNTYLLIEPKSLINKVNLTYVRVPNTPSWAYTTTNDRPIYDSANSRDLDAPKSAFNEIAMITLEFLSIKIGAVELSQAALGMENKGV